MKHNHDNDSFYSSERWKKKREMILKRDNYRCQICKRYGRIKQATIVHHIKELDEYPELAFENSNLQSLCMGCHNKMHPDKAKAMNDTKWMRRYD